jgi:uncharacterized ferritin-like protein (DUF455 family)
MAAPVSQHEVLVALAECSPAAKCEATLAWSQPGLRFDIAGWQPLSTELFPGRPPRPELVEPAQLARRRLGGEAGRAALVHAIAHIEFNAINLALDAACRFGDMPESYYLDWLSVAADEARHFRMLQQRLHDLGFEYGDFPAHDGLWEMAMRTTGSCLERMALVPRVLEARGLDVTPGMIQRLERAGDTQTIAVLEVILAEEVRHVAIGSHWFEHCCAQAGLEPGATFLDLLDRHYRGRIKGPLTLPDRRRAGFSEHELDALQEHN